MNSVASNCPRRVLALLAPDRGPKPEEAYIEVPARNMISIYIYTVYTRGIEI
jgi:hypothetical protein